MVANGAGETPGPCAAVATVFICMWALVLKCEPWDFNSVPLRDPLAGISVSYQTGLPGDRGLALRG